VYGLKLSVTLDEQILAVYGLKKKSVTFDAQILVVYGLKNILIYKISKVEDPGPKGTSYPITTTMKITSLDSTFYFIFFWGGGGHLP